MIVLETMIAPPTPLAEAQRLASLARYGVMDTLPEAEYDDITRLAASICAAPIALVSLVEADRQWFKSSCGLSASETPRNISFCGHAVAQEAPLFVIDDAREDERFFDNPLVTGEPYIRFYAGAQLRTPEGHCIGTLCIADREPRSLTAAQEEALLALARSVMRGLESRLTVAELNAANLNLRLLESAVSQTSDAVTIYEVDRTDLVPLGIRFINAAFSQMTGYTVAEILGHNPRTIFDGNYTESTLTAIQRAYRDFTPLRTEAELRRKDGSRVSVEMNLSPVGTDRSSSKALWVAVLRDLSERRSAEQAAAEALKSGGLIEQIPAILSIVDCDLRFTASVGAGLRALNLLPGQIVGTFLQDFYAADPRAGEILDAHRAVLGGKARAFEHATRSRNYRTFLEPHRNATGAIVGVIGIALDVTDHQRDRDALVTTESKLLLAQSTAQLGSWEIDLRSGVAVGSHELYRLYDITPRDGCTSLAALRARQLPQDVTGTAAAIERAKRLKEAYGIDYRIELADGSVRWLQERGIFHYDDSGVATHATGTSLDITDRKIAEERLKRLAHEDTLTGLCNRTRFIEQLAAELTHPRCGGELTYVLFIDIDHFKAVNDTLGHISGDRLLREAAQRLSEATGPTDIVARTGGDEFIILTSGSRQSVTRLLDRTMHAFSEPFVIGAQSLYCTISIGVTRAPDDGSDAEELLRNADTAMYAAKAAGRNAVRFFDAEMHQRVARRLTLENDLRRAIEREEFVLYYQPTFDQHVRMTGVEALIRWQHPTQGLVFPDNFIGIAEETGLIVPIGAWVIRTACAQLAHWSQTYGSDLQMAVNLSGRQLESPDLLDTLINAVAASGLPYSRFTLELTESVIMADVDSAIAMLTQFKALGFRMSVDDFGTGYSSLSSLKQLPIDTLKIDRSFIGNTPEDADDCAIVDAVIALGRSLNLTLLAEGVETSPQLEHLLERGCNEFQGYLLGRPQPAAALAALLGAVVPVVG